MSALRSLTGVKRTYAQCAIRRLGTSSRAYNLLNQSTQYQNGVDMHLDWSASQFLTKQFQIGAVGYVYKEIGCDSGSGDRVGCFQSQSSGLARSSASSFRSGTFRAISAGLSLGGI